MKRLRTAAVEPESVQDPGTARGLAIAGLLTLVTILILYNPFGGVREELWPWELFSSGAATLLFQTLFAAWIFTGLWCALLAFTRMRRLRALSAVALVGFLLLQNAVVENALAQTSILFSDMLCLIGLGAGLWLARDAATRGLGRLLAGAGAVFLIWSMATGVGTSQLETYLQEMKALFQTGAPASEEGHYLWLTLIPQTLFLLGALTGLFAMLGFTKRICLTTSFYLLLAGLSVPVIVGIFLPSSTGVGSVVKDFVAHGILLWLLGVFALVDLGRTEREAA